MKLEITGAAALIFLGLAVVLLGSSEVSSSRDYSSKKENKAEKSSALDQSSVSKNSKEEISFAEANSLKKKLTIKAPSELPSSQQAAKLVNLPVKTSSDSGLPRKSLEEIPN